MSAMRYVFDLEMPPVYLGETMAVVTQHQGVTIAYEGADGHLPVSSFWSLSLYEATPDGQFFFTDNPLARYAIGDRTQGLVAAPDGSLDIWIGHTDPGGECTANWLPAPAGPFALFMRAYLPKTELLEGGYRLPPVVAA